MTRAERLSGILLMCVALAVAAVVTRDFARYTDHFPYLAVDDSLGNVAYNVATQGQYGFPASPLQGRVYITRHRGFFNYGPWYFYAGAALIWMFGYGIGLLRSLHLIGILAISATGCCWFGRRRQFVPGALVSLGLLYAFDVGQWPMVRPDIAVSVFAVMFIVAAGLAIENGSPVAWFVAALGAGCAIFTHLIAWALGPCCLFTLAASLVNSRPGRRPALVALLAVAAGFAASAVMFYGSFGFRIGDQLVLLRNYGGFLSGAATDSRPVLVSHLRMGFSYLGVAGRIAIGAAVAASLALVTASVRWPRPVRTSVLAMLLPPVAVLCFYVGSLAVYANYHAGYEILAQVGAWWCAGAAVSTILWLLERRHPAQARLLTLGASLALIAAGAIQFSTRVQADSNPRLAYVREWVSIPDYVDRIGALVSPGTSVWGSPIFGIDSPGRFELVDAGAALGVLERARWSHPVDTRAVAPAYLIWGYVNNRDNMMEVFDSSFQANEFNRVRDSLAPFSYRLIGLVAAAPYGVTRVYQRVSAGGGQPMRLPVVSAFDRTTQSWDTRVEGPLAVQAAPADPVSFDLRYGSFKGAVRADRTLRTDLPSGRYLLRVRLESAARSKRPTVLAVTSAPSISEEFGELGPSIDVSPYVGGDEDAYLFHAHPGGALYVSQLAQGEGVTLGGLEVYRVLPALHDDQRADRTAFADFALAEWLPQVSRGVQAALTDTGAVTVNGDATEGGYQITSPARPAIAQSTVTLRFDFTLSEGRVCVGALNGADAWLANGGDPARDFSFAMDATGAFRAVLYNCNPSGRGNAPSRFTVTRGRYAVTEAGMYVDRLLATMNPTARPSPLAANATAPRVIPAEEVSRIQIPLRSPDLQFRAPNLFDAGEGWQLRGRAAGRFSYVMRSTPSKRTGYRLVAKGVIRRGGLTIGLMRNEAWAASVNVTAPGPFTVTVDPPEPGAVYDALIANDLESGPLTTDVEIERVGWAPLERR